MRSNNNKDFLRNTGTGAHIAPASYHEPSQIKGQPELLMVFSLPVSGRATAYALLSFATYDKT